MNLRRDAWRDVSQLIQNNPQLPDSYWWEFMRDTYMITQAVAVRRQADTHKDVASLGKLIQEVRDDPSRITRDFWLGLWDDLSDPIDRHFAESAWTKQYAGSSGTSLDPAIPRHDFDTLVDTAARVKDYVDKHVAHAEEVRTRVPAPTVLSVRDIGDAIDVIGDLFKKYNNLFTASSFVFLVPAIQHDWKAIFREPWLRAPKTT